MSKRDVIRKLAGLKKGVNQRKKNRRMDECLLVMSKHCKEHIGYCYNCPHYKSLSELPMERCYNEFSI